MITVIIPTVNDAYLEKTIINISDAAIEPLEIIVVDDGSEIPVKNDFLTKHIGRIIRHEKTLGRRVSINEAAREANGSHLFILDAHCSMSDGWDAKMLESCPEKGIVVSCIQDMYGESYELRPGIYSHVYLNRGYEEKWWNRKSVKTTEEMMCFTGCSWLIPKEYYWQCGGYDESLGQYGWDGPEWACKVWMGHNPGKVLLRSDVLCGHVFGTNEHNKLFKTSRIPFGDYRKYMMKRYGGKIERFREKFSPLPDDKARDIVTTVLKVDTVETKQGDEVIRIVKRHYKPYKVRHDGTKSDSEIEASVLDLITEVEREEVVLE